MTNFAQIYSKHDITKPELSYEAQVYMHVFSEVDEITRLEIVADRAGLVKEQRIGLAYGHA